jgi:hypothetical protein
MLTRGQTARVPEGMSLAQAVDHVARLVDCGGSAECGGGGGAGAAPHSLRAVHIAYAEGTLDVTARDRRQLSVMDLKVELHPVAGKGADRGREAEDELSEVSTVARTMPAPTCFGAAQLCISRRLAKGSSAAMPWRCIAGPRRPAARGKKNPWSNSKTPPPPPPGLAGAAGDV